MRFSIQREILLKPLQQVIGVVERRQTLPVLSNLLVVSGAGRVTFTGTDLEGALNTLAARANFLGLPITEDFAQETLRDLLTVHSQSITLSNIQKTVADYYQLRLSDLLSKNRSRSLARPRQIAMALAKELTEHSLPEIGKAFGGRDHTTVMHACRTIRDLCLIDGKLRQDWEKLLRELTG